MLDKSFDPQEAERRIYKAWEDSGAFQAGRRPGAEAFAIVIPPPNVTGRLHIGHALNNTLQDALARFERMRGKDVLWQPGTDHAGIATQLIVERQLAERQISRVSLGREKFLEAVWKWKEESGGAIGQQQRRLGASADWSRDRFTMDEGLSRAVLKVFVELYRQGLIYKDKRLVNWDPRLQTAVSDLEVESIEMKGHLWYIKYPIEGQAGQFITVATTRPETMLGDTAVAVHPGDERYTALIGKQVRVPLANRLIPIVADEHSDPEKGTGAVKITPGHDFNDFEVGKRHNLPLINILNKDGTLNDSVPEPYRGLDRFVARKTIVADLEAMELVAKIEPITHAVPHDEKTKTVVLEPFMTEQWYLNVQPLAEKAIKAVEDGRTKFVPENWAGVYFNWMRNIHPWCISRQLWWGHQIPVWYDADGKIYCAETEDEAQAQAPGKTLTRDPDVLDTWFSSALWPFSTLGWPDETPELARYYPTNVLVTGFDIIFFWVARMMMMGLWFLDDVPFHTVFIHTRVLDEAGVKMSKTKGNVVDPITLIDEYGADALRFTLALAAGQGRDMRIGPSRVEINRNFCTKLWNAARFCEMNGCETVAGFDPAAMTLPMNRWILSELRSSAYAINDMLLLLRFNDAAAEAYHFVWDSFCDWYLELAKPIFNGDDDVAKGETRATAAFVRDNILKLLHPFIPFITEELWTRTADNVEPRSTLLIEAEWPWPGLSTIHQDVPAMAEMGWVIDLISGIRSIRSEMNVPPSAKIAMVLKDAAPESRARLDRNRDVIMTLARLASAHAADGLPQGSAQFVLGEATVALPLGDVIDFAKERARLEKELKKAEDEIARFDAKLSNEQFVSRAPEEVLTEQREKRADAAALAIRLKDAVSRLA
ncbi:MAG TPA: valine--tRNA ligase [Rhizomicrobium sp.]|jgi:valyl-tRNA synthetase|nr:valine--tRNA ligase [Rhizomicrobium sp.]